MRTPPSTPPPALEPRSLRRAWRKRDCAATPRWTPRCGVLGRPDRNTAIEAPCVLASRRPSNRVDEHHSAKPSWSRRIAEYRSALAGHRASVTGPLLGAGLSAIALGGVLERLAEDVLGRRCGCRRPARPPSRYRGVLGARVAARLGDAFTSSFAPRLGVDGLSGLFLGMLGLIAAPALVFSVRYLRPSPHGRAVGCADRAVRARARSRPLRARPADVPRRLGVDDARSGGGDPRLARRRPACAADRLHLPRGDAPRRRGHVDRDPAARAGRRDRRPHGDRVRLGAADGDRACRRSSAWGRRRA